MFKYIYSAASLFILIPSVGNAQDKQQPASAPQPAEITKPKAISPVILPADPIKTGDHLIVPGERIGPVVLGATLEEVKKTLGDPLETTQLGGNFECSSWSWMMPEKEGSHRVFSLSFASKTV